MAEQQNRPPVKDEKLYQTLREEQGYSKEKSARIANAANNEGRDTQGEGRHLPQLREVDRR